MKIANYLLIASLLSPVFLNAEPIGNKKQNDSIEAIFEQARAKAFSGQYDEAIKIYSGLIASNPKDADARLGRGRVYAWKGLYKEAEGDLLRVVQSSPKYSDAWSALTDTYLWSGQFEKAGDAIEKWVQIDAKNSTAFIQRAKANRDLRRFSEARNDLRKARQLNGDPKAIDSILRELSRIPAARPWEMSAAFDHSSFPYDREEWTSYNAAIKREHPWGSSQIESTKAKRFSLWDRAIAFDNYLNLWKRAYLNARIQAGLDSIFFPKADAYAELFQGFAQGWEISGSYRYSRYASDNADQYGVGFGWYVSRFYFRGKSVFIPTNAEPGYSQQFLSRIYLKTIDDFVEMSGGFGKDVVIAGSGPDDRRVKFIGGCIQKFIAPWLGLSLSGNYQDFEKIPPERNIRVQIILRP